MTTTNRSARTRIFLLMLMTAAALLWSAASQAALIPVTDPNDILGPGDGVCTLREAIGNANLPAGGDLTLGDCVPGDPGVDTIDIPPGLYLLSLLGAFEDVNNTGDLDILDELILQGSGAAATEIDGLGLDRIMDIDPFGLGFPVQIIELSLVGGQPPGGAGGCMRVRAGSRVEIFDSLVARNKAELGGGIANEGQVFMQNTNMRGNETTVPNDGGAIWNVGGVEINDGTFVANKSQRHGGAIYNAGDLVILGTTLDSNSAVLSGGAVFNELSTFAQGAVFTLNDATDGGAVYHQSGFTEIDSSSLANNTASNTGGAITSTDNINVQRSEISRSIAGGDGGALHHTSGLLVINNVDIWGSQSGGTGGAIFNSADLEAQLLDIFNGQANGNGGGVYNEGTAVLDRSSVNFNGALDGAGIYNNLVLFLNESLIAGNQGIDGAGLYTGGPSDTDMLNTTISDNHAANDGGGIFAFGTLRIEFSTIALNEANASPSGGLLNAGAVFAKNSLFQRNSTDCLHAGFFTSFGFNMDFDGSCALAALGDMPGVDAMIEPLANYGGPTDTHALPFGSLAVDTADPLCLSQIGVNIGRDQRGIPRPQDGDNSGTQECDRGAYELVPPSGPIPPVPNGIFGTAMVPTPLDPAASNIEIKWDVALCPASGYHLLYGDLNTVGTYTVSGSQCGLSTSGADVWTGVPAGDWWFVIVPDDAVFTEGSWGTDSTGADRKGPVPSFECTKVARTNVGTCP